MPQVDAYPELACFRDVVFAFKAMQVPTSDNLPPVRAWRPEDGILVWRSQPAAPKPKPKREGCYCVPPRPLICKAFGRILAIATGSSTYTAEEARQRRSTWRQFLDYVGVGALPRAPPSRGEPSVLVGSKVETEEDVLHIRNLPDFGGHLSGRDAELILSYLTAPYVRMPLLLRFFTDHARLRALASCELRDVLDACLFEPGLWRPPSNSNELILTTVPAQDRGALATPCGLLFNELCCSPSGLIGALDAFLDNVKRAASRGTHNMYPRLQK